MKQYISLFLLMTSSKSARVNKQASMSSWVHTYAVEYWQLIMNSMCATFPNNAADSFFGEFA